MSELVEVKTIGEVERIVHASGLWDGTGPVEFSDDGETWVEAWAPTHALLDDTLAITHPTFARVTVYRKDVRVPTAVTIRWDEQVPIESPEWSEKWHRSPMRHFGRTARMVGFRQTFRDLLGDIVIEDEDRSSTPTTADADDAPRDWKLEIATAATADEIEEIGKAARAARVFKPTAEGTALHRAWKARHAELIDAAWMPPAPAPELSPRELAEHHRFFPEDAACAAYEVAKVAEPVRVLPQDHLPGNRAQRRASARRKGRR